MCDGGGGGFYLLLCHKSLHFLHACVCVRVCAMQTKQKVESKTKKKQQQ